MEEKKGILIFGGRQRENETLSCLLTAEGYSVFETPSALRALGILQKEEIGVIVADKNIEGIETSDFKSLLEKISPGVTTLFMAQRHMHEFGTTPGQMAMVSVKNHGNALFNRFAQAPARLSVEDVRSSRMVSTPLTVRDCSLMSDGAAVVIVASEGAAQKLCSRPVKITGIGCGGDTMRLADRPRGRIVLLPHESEDDYRGLKYPGVHSFRGCRTAAKAAYEMANITDPIGQVDFVEIYDSYTSSEIQGYEDLGLCRYGEGGRFVESGAPFMPDLDYGLEFRDRGRWRSVPVNPSGGLLACGHAIGATGLMQAVFAFWQLQGSIGSHLGNGTLQVKNARRGVVQSHGGTGTTATVTVMESVS